MLAEDLRQEWSIGGCKQETFQVDAIKKKLLKETRCISNIEPLGTPNKKHFFNERNAGVVRKGFISSKLVY